MKKACLVVICALFVGIYGGYVSPCQAAEPKIDPQAILAKKVPVLVEFGSNCCSPCNYSKQLLDDLAMSYGGRAVVVGADVAVNKDWHENSKSGLHPPRSSCLLMAKSFSGRKETCNESSSRSFQQDGIGAACHRNQPWACSRSQAPTLPTVPGYSTTRQ